MSGFSYALIRQPSQRELLQLARQSDILVQNLISLRTLVPLILSRKPVVVIHQSWLRRHDGTRGLANYAKLLALRCCHNVSISQAIAASLPVPSEVLGNPFEAEEFAKLGDIERNIDIVFMGRLVSDKGCDLLLLALAHLKRRGLEPTTTIIGDGPEMPKLRAMVEELELKDQVAFKGAMREGRGHVVAQHRIMVIPSVWAEPFGIVALEGVASGCAIVASSEGGLPDAGGPCGLYFPNRDAQAMASSLEKLLLDIGLRESLTAAAPTHLKRFQPNAVATRYLEIFEKLAR